MVQSLKNRWQISNPTAPEQRCKCLHFFPHGIPQDAMYQEGRGTDGVILWGT
jgi:hypothetical protein